MTDLNATPNRQNVVLLRIMCVLTILGSVLMGLVLVFLIMAPNPFWGNDDHQSLYLITMFGTLIGAVLMFRKQLSGLYIYGLSQATFIISATINGFSEHLPKNDTGGIMINLLFIIPALLFLTYYVVWGRKALS